MAKELDKDLMFQKIMPAIKENPFSTVYNGGNNTEAPAQEKVISMPVESTDDLSVLRNRLFKKTEYYNSENDFATINIMEELILKELDTVITKFNACSCDRCKCDITAYALNLLTPKYIVASPEEIRKAEKEIPVKDITSALIKAVIYVRQHPSH